MTLTFPTQAEQVHELAEKVGTVANACRALGFKPHFEKAFTGERTYVFDDDTRLITKGAGKNYKRWTELP